MAHPVSFSVTRPERSLRRPNWRSLMNRGVIPIVLIVAMALLLVSCDPGESLIFMNDTEELLLVGINERGNDLLPPQKRSILGYLTEHLGKGGDPLQIIILDESGCLVLEVNTTLNAFREERDLTLIIQPSDLPPPDERVNCEPEDS